MTVAIRAPAEDGATLAVPPLEEAGRLIAENRKRLIPWAERRREARRELLAVEPSDAPFLLAGHQPELFHPGVWFKNFALAGLARRHGGVSVNLVVDNDSVKSTSLRVPAHGDPWPEAHSVAFDRWEGETPWEERRVHDRATFARFGDEASARMREWGVEPLLPAFWAGVLRHLDVHRGLIGLSFAAARRDLEREWGCFNVEPTLSSVCRGESFGRFAGGILGDLPRFVAVYNAAVRDHRRRHGIKSRNHPVPDLATDGDWLEAPLWGWTAARPRRARLFARLRPDRVELRAGGDVWPSVPIHQERFAEMWRSLEREGYKVRSRALVTTMYSRLLLADLFVHGIGGGKYDELTDEILRRFWGVEPPAFLVLTATRRLPLPTFPAREEDRRRITHEIRDLHYNPQRHAPPGELAAEKAAWVARTPATRAERRERFRRIRELSAAMRPSVGGALADAEASLSRVGRELAANALLRRRDFAFCLFPEASLRPLLTRFL